MTANCMAQVISVAGAGNGVLLKQGNTRKPLTNLTYILKGCITLQLSLFILAVLGLSLCIVYV